MTETMPDMRSISMGVMVDAGPRDELPDQGGLAHLTEHAMFQGTGSRNAMQIARMIDSAGGQMGAFTARDYTCYSATVLDDYYPYVLDLLGDILLNSVFPAEHLEREKMAILRELDAGNDVPNERVHTLLKAFVWSDHPLGRPIIGDPESLKKLEREHVIKFVLENYLPNRFIVAAAGNVGHEDFVAQVRDAFWRMLPQRSVADGQMPLVMYDTGPENLPPYQSGVTIENVPVSQAYYSIGIRAWPYAHPDRYGMYVLNNILGGGISSRLFLRLREERGLVYDISSEYHAYRDDGLLVIEGSTAPEHLMQVLGLTLIELWRLVTADDPADEEELWKARMQIRGQHLIAGEDTNTRMSRLATQELYFGRQIPGDEILGKIEAMNITSFQEFADKALAHSLPGITVAIVGPDAPEYYSVSMVEELLEDF
ncbi:MAG: insulinase family protein [Desulfobacterales bacterium]|nr:insulinase family protein [Desulfobacterales bacterium]